MSISWLRRTAKYIHQSGELNRKRLSINGNVHYSRSTSTADVMEYFHVILQTNCMHFKVYVACANEKPTNIYRPESVYFCQLPSGPHLSDLYRIWHVECSPNAIIVEQSLMKKCHAIRVLGLQRAANCVSFSLTADAGQTE